MAEEVAEASCLEDSIDRYSGCDLLWVAGLPVLIGGWACRSDGPEELHALLKQFGPSRNEEHRALVRLNIATWLLIQGHFVLEKLTQTISHLFVWKLVGATTRTTIKLAMIRAPAMKPTMNILPRLAGNLPRMIQYCASKYR